MKIADIILPTYSPDNNPVEIAKATGQEIVEPKPNQLLIDIDTEEQAVRFKAGIDMLMQLGIKCSYSVVDSKTAGHKHVTVELDINLTDHERVILQACLGSDPRRELYSFMRLRLGMAKPIILFRGKPIDKKTGGGV